MLHRLLPLLCAVAGQLLDKEPLSRSLALARRADRRDSTNESSTQIRDFVSQQFLGSDAVGDDLLFSMRESFARILLPVPDLMQLIQIQSLDYLRPPEVLLPTVTYSALDEAVTIQREDYFHMLLVQLILGSALCLEFVRLLILVPRKVCMATSSGRSPYDAVTTLSPRDPPGSEMERLYSPRAARSSYFKEPTIIPLCVGRVLHFGFQLMTAGSLAFTALYGLISAADGPDWEVLVIWVAANLADMLLQVVLRTLTRPTLSFSDTVWSSVLMAFVPCMGDRADIFLDWVFPAFCVAANTNQDLFFAATSVLVLVYSQYRIYTNTELMEHMTEDHFRILSPDDPEKVALMQVFTGDEPVGDYFRCRVAGAALPVRLEIAKWKDLPHGALKCCFLATCPELTWSLAGFLVFTTAVNFAQAAVVLVLDYMERHYGTTVGPTMLQHARMLQHPDADRREAACRALAGRGKAAHHHALAICQVLEDESLGVRLAACNAVVACGAAILPRASAAIDSLANLLQESDPAVVFSAVEALATWGPAAERHREAQIDAVAGCLRHETPAVVLQAAGLLVTWGAAAERHEVAAMKALNAQLKHRDSEMRCKACRAIGEWGPAAAHHAELLRERFTDSHGSVQRAAKLAVDKIETPTPASSHASGSYLLGFKRSLA